MFAYVIYESVCLEDVRSPVFVNGGFRPNFLWVNNPSEISKFGISPSCEFDSFLFGSLPNATKFFIVNFAYSREMLSLNSWRNSLQKHTFFRIFVMSQHSICGNGSLRHKKTVIALTFYLALTLNCALPLIVYSHPSTHVLFFQFVQHETWNFLHRCPQRRPVLPSTCQWRRSSDQQFL